MWHDEQKSGVCFVWNGLRKISLCGCGSISVMRSCAKRRIGLSLAARSCSGGYSISKSPCPIVLRTLVMAWHDVHDRPACASAVSICSLIGFSNRPLKNTA